MYIPQKSNNTHFGAKLSPAFRKMVGDYRDTLRKNRDFSELHRLQKTMVKIKFLCAGQEISDDFKLNNKIQLLNIDKNTIALNNGFLEKLLDSLERLNKNKTTCR